MARAVRRHVNPLTAATCSKLPRSPRPKLSLTAAVHLRIPKADIQRVMGPGIAELMATIAAQGISSDGPVVYPPPYDGRRHVGLRDQRARERPGHRRPAASSRVSGPA